MESLLRMYKGLQLCMWTQGRAGLLYLGTQDRRCELSRVMAGDRAAAPPGL